MCAHTCQSTPPHSAWCHPPHALSEPAMADASGAATSSKPAGTGNALDNAAEHYKWASTISSTRQELDRLGAVQGPSELTEASPAPSASSAGSAWNQGGTWCVEIRRLSRRRHGHRTPHVHGLAQGRRGNHRQGDGSAEGALQGVQQGCQRRRHGRHAAVPEGAPLRRHRHNHLQSGKGECKHAAPPCGSAAALGLSAAGAQSVQGAFVPASACGHETGAETPGTRPPSPALCRPALATN